MSLLPARSNGFITFGTYNNLAKVQPAVVAVWAEILARVPTARFVLKSKAFHSPVRPAARQRAGVTAPHRTNTPHNA